MKQFKPYPIFISGNTLTDDEIKQEIQRRLKDYDHQLKTNPKFRAEIEEAKRKKGFTEEYGREMIRDLSFDSTLKTIIPFDEQYRFLEAMRPDSSPKAVKFEKKMFSYLEAINKTAIGKLVLESLTAKKKFWITLLEGQEQTDCSCFAQTDDAPIKDHIQIKYPMPTETSRSRWYMTKGEDILLHEMVHAYRQGIGLSNFETYKDQGEYLRVEEFIATLFQNIYLSTIGELQFYRYARNMRVLPLTDYYAYLGSNVEIFRVLKYSLEKEPLSYKVRRWAVPSFNPLRDYSDISTILYNNIRKR